MTNRGWRELALVAVAVVSPGCGGDGSPAAGSTPAPTPRAPTMLTVQSGEDATPIAGAVVALGGSRLDVDAAGHLMLPDSARTGNPMDVLAGGFFDRLTTVPADSSVIGLWPLRSPTGLTESYTAQLVYTATQDGSPLGGESLERPLGPVYLVPSAELRADVRALHELEYGAAMVGEATEGQMLFAVTDAPPSGAIRFDVKLDPYDASCEDFLAYCQYTTRNSAIVRGKIVFCDPGSPYTSTVTHEVGHAFGLRHSPASFDMMAGRFSWNRSHDFTPRERLAMRLMLQRRPGNRYPDTDRAGGAAGLRSKTIVCR